ncbi:hypothetical protein Tco_1383943 [Tanacetum coccineum]
MDTQSNQTIKLPILQPENGNAPIVTKTVDCKETVLLLRQSQPSKCLESGRRYGKTSLVVPGVLLGGKNGFLAIQLGVWQF